MNVQNQSFRALGTDYQRPLVISQADNLWGHQDKRVDEFQVP